MIFGWASSQATAASSGDSDDVEPESGMKSGYTSGYNSGYNTEGDPDYDEVSSSIPLRLLHWLTHFDRLFTFSLERWEDQIQSRRSRERLVIAPALATDLARISTSPPSTTRSRDRAELENETSRLVQALRLRSSRTRVELSSLALWCGEGKRRRDSPKIVDLVSFCRLFFCLSVLVHCIGPLSLELDAVLPSFRIDFHSLCLASSRPRTRGD